MVSKGTTTFEPKRPGGGWIVINGGRKKANEEHAKLINAPEGFRLFYELGENINLSIINMRLLVVYKIGFHDYIIY